MADENQVDHGRNIAVLAQDQEVDEHLKEYQDVLRGKKEGSLAASVGSLERILTKDDPALEDQGIILNASPQAIEYEVDNYHQKSAEDVKKALDESGSQIAEDYASNLDNIIRAIVEQIVSQTEGFSELPDEQKDALIQPSLYVNLADVLKELEPQNEDATKAKQDLGKLDEASESEIYDIVNGYLTERVGLSPNAINLVRNPTKVYNDGVKQYQTAMYARIIASELVKKDEEGKYSIDKGKFKELYGSDNNYKKIAYDMVQAIRQAAAQEAQQEGE